MFIFAIMKIRAFLILLSLIVLVGCGAKNPVSGKKINQSFNKEQNDYFIIREPDSVFFTQKGQSILLNEYSKNYIVYENRFTNEAEGIDDFLKKLDENLKKGGFVDVLYSRPQPVDVKTFHWNVFAIKRDKNGAFLIISNENDKKAKEMQKVFETMDVMYGKKNVKTIFLPQIQYSHKGCSVKGVIFTRALHKNNDECLTALSNLANKKQNKFYIKEFGKDEYKLVDLVNKRYAKFTQKDDIFQKGILDKKFIIRHQSGTHLKKDKNKVDVWVKTSKLHDKGYSFIYNVLLNNENVLKNTKITKDDILKINRNFHLK